MEFPDVIRKRRMTRSFLERALEPATVERILECGLRGPTAGFTQGVELLSLLGPIETGRYWAASLPEEDRVRFQWPGLLHAPLLIVVLASESAYRRRYGEPDKVRSSIDVPWWHVDAAFAALLLQLAAVDAGLGALFFRTHQVDQLRAALGIPPTYAPVGTVAVGYPDSDRPSSSVVRRAGRPDSARIHRGGW